MVTGHRGSAAHTQKRGVLPQWSQSLFALIFSNSPITVTSAGEQQQAAQPCGVPRRWHPGPRGAFLARPLRAPTEVNTCISASPSSTTLPTPALPLPRKPRLGPGPPSQRTQPLARRRPRLTQHPLRAPHDHPARRPGSRSPQVCGKQQVAQKSSPAAASGVRPRRRLRGAGEQACASRSRSSPAHFSSPGTRSFADSQTSAAPRAPTALAPAPARRGAAAASAASGPGPREAPTPTRRPTPALALRAPSASPRPAGPRSAAQRQASARRAPGTAALVSPGTPSPEPRRPSPRGGAPRSVRPPPARPSKHPRSPPRALLQAAAPSRLPRDPRRLSGSL